MTEFAHQRPWAALIREANGDRSREQAAAALKLAANSIVAYRAAVNAVGLQQAAVVGTANIDNAVVAGLDTYKLYIGNGDDIEEIAFTSGGINTKAELKTALEALAFTTGTINGADKVTLTGKDGKPVQVDASNAAVFAALGLVEGVTNATPAVSATVAGYVPYGTAGAVEGSAAYCPTEVAKGAQGVFVVRDATLKDALLQVDEDDFDDAVADLKANGLIVRETLVL